MNTYWKQWSISEIDHCLGIDFDKDDDTDLCQDELDTNLRQRGCQGCSGCMSCLGMSNSDFF